MLNHFSKVPLQTQHMSGHMPKARSMSQNSERTQGEHDHEMNHTLPINNTHLFNKMKYFHYSKPLTYYNNNSYRLTVQISSISLQNFLKLTSSLRVRNLL